MSENKAKLIALMSAIEEENIIDYFYNFSGLKVYESAAKLLESIRTDLRRLWDEHGIQLDEEDLNYINIIVSDIVKEIREGSEK